MHKGHLSFLCELSVPILARFSVAVLSFLSSSAGSALHVNKISPSFMVLIIFPLGNHLPLDFAYGAFFFSYLSSPPFYSF